MRLYTARFANRTLAPHPAAKVQISLGAPKFPLPYNLHQLLELAPAGFMLHKPEADFAGLYTKLLQRRGGAEFFAERFAEVARTAGVDQLALLCYEDLRTPGLWCHRRVFASWYQEQVGEEVLEIEEAA